MALLFRAGAHRVRDAYTKSIKGAVLKHFSNTEHHFINHTVFVLSAFVYPGVAQAIYSVDDTYQTKLTYYLVISSTGCDTFIATYY